MDSEVISALVGVAFGVVGTLISARAQVRGATTQADAMVRQATEAYRAALDQAHATHVAAHRQWRRGVRRDAYAQFVTALDAVEQLVMDPELVDGTPSGVSALTSARRTLQSSHTVLQLEGPEGLLDLAARTYDACSQLIVHAQRMAPRATGLRALTAATGGTNTERADRDSPSGRAAAAHRALTQLREAVFRHDTGGLDSEAYERAYQRAASSLEACPVLSAEQVRALLADPSWEVALEQGRQHAEAVQRLAQVRSAFVDAARRQLDDHTPAAP